VLTSAAQATIRDHAQVTEFTRDSETAAKHV
jgi:hypothetical protein